MSPSRHWSSRIRSATTTAAVLELLGNFLGSIPPSEMERLPREIRAELGRPQRDIHTIAVEVLRQDLRFAGEAHAGEVLHEVALAFAEASGRLVEIEGDRA